MNKFVSATLTTGLLAIPALATAATISINPNIPGVDSPTDLVSIVVNFYQFALLTGAVLAFGSIVYGAVNYALSESAGTKNDAKDRIVDAFIGLVLLAGAYLLLYTINPALTILTNPGLEKISEVTAQSAGAGSAGSTSDTNSNNVTCFKQGDPRWGSKTYGPDSSYSTYAEGGCGPTALAMIVKTLTGKDITPETVGQQCVDKGWRIRGNGTAWAAMTGIPQIYGLKSQNIGNNLASAKQCIEKGGLVISSMRGGGACNEFTRGEGHFIALTGTENGEINFNDPGPKSPSCYRKAPDNLIQQCAKNFWCISK